MCWFVRQGYAVLIIVQMSRDSWIRFRKHGN